MREIKFGDLELNTTKDVLDKLIILTSESKDNGFTSETIKLTRDIIINILKYDSNNK